MPTINETLKQLEVQRNRAQKELAGLEAAINALKPLVGVAIGAAPAKSVAPVAVVAVKRRKMSAAGRASIRAAVQARWAKIRAEKAQGAGAGSASVKIAKAVVAAPAKRGKMSAATKAKLRASAKARWAKIKAGKAKAKK